jgi:hypothetical protein
MGMKKTLVAGLAAAALSVPFTSNAATLDFVFNWGGTTEGGAVPQSLPVRILDFTAESSIVFNGAPFTAGTTFNDFVVLRINQLFDANQTQVLTPYGPLFGMEVTIKAWLTGTQLDATNYVINGIKQFECKRSPSSAPQRDQRRCGGFQSMKGTSVMPRALPFARRAGS